VFTTTKPVTHTAEADVNSASKNPMLLPFCDAIGRFNKMAPIKIIDKNPSARILGGFNSNPFILSLIADIICLR
jgi:hypothetical protein